jgi:hypothetical protein
MRGACRKSMPAPSRPGAAAGPIAGGTYPLQFDLDRPRWRTAAPDATTATPPLAWT